MVVSRQRSNATVMPMLALAWSLRSPLSDLLAEFMWRCKQMDHLDRPCSSFICLQH